MKDCIFCKIAKGEIPCHKIFEDRDFLAFLDAFPFCRGHTLVIPKKHYRWVWDVPNLEAYFSVVGKVVSHYQRELKDEFVASIIWGMEIPHAHIQILPRPRKLFLNWERGKLEEKEGKQIAKELSLK